MALAHRPLSDQAGFRTAALAFVLCGVALLPACAGYTQHAVNRAEPSQPSLAGALAKSDAATPPTGHVAQHVAWYSTGSMAYVDRKAPGAMRPTQRSNTGIRSDEVRRTGAISDAPARLARAAPTLSGDASERIATPPETAPGSRGRANLDVSSIAFDVPTSMTLDRRTLIQLALAATPDDAYAIAPTATDAAGAGQYIEARLSGGDFVIEPVTADTQALRTAKTTEWLWLVTPKKPGRQQLQLTVTALTDDDSTPLRRALPTFEHTVLVSTRWDDDLRTRVETHAAWLWAAAWATPLLLLWAYLRWRRKHRRWFRSGV